MEQSVVRRILACIVAMTLVFGSLVSQAVAQTEATPIGDATPVGAATPVASPVASPVAADSANGSVDLDMLFIGAHPDDEAFGLAAYGQWNEFNDAQVGVVTITRGEGGGNAVGTEEGPALGMLREAEERRAVGVSGIEHIYNLDKVDFYYTVSAPLTEETWGYDETLEPIVRVIRETKPEVIITMNPSPTPGNHGHHQVAARLAVDAFYQAADTENFPDQLATEGLDAWSVSRIFRSGASGEGQPGPDCATSYVPNEPTDTVYGVWQGTVSEANGGRTWVDLAREGQRMYASQGWAVFPDAETDPALIECNYFTLIDSRVAQPIDTAATTAVLDNAVLEIQNSLPLGSQLYLTTDAFRLQPGQEFTVTSHVRVPADLDTADSAIQLVAPEGWEVVGAAELDADPEATPVITTTPDGEITQEFRIIVPEDAEANTRYRIGASYGVGRNIGVTSEVVEVVPPVSGVLAPLPEIAQFREWVDRLGVQQLDSLIAPVQSIAVGATRDIPVAVTNSSDQPQSGTVTIELPAGFEAAEPSVPFDAVGPGETTEVVFAVTNADPALPTANEGGEEGMYPFSITTEAGGTSSTRDAGLNLVPSAVVPQAATAPTIDGAIGAGEYTGEALDLSRVWEGDDPDSAADASGEAYVTWTEEGIVVAVQVQDEMLGTVLPEADAKRHWRTDSVEIAIDPLGTAPNTSATFKVGVFPTTQEGNPAAYRDADAFQGPVSETAPGFQVASALTEPYTGYVIETLIPYDALPADIDPANAAMNIFIYDSDTQDLTGQSRLGWSVYNGVQGDPYRWGKTTFEGYTPPTDARTEPAAPRMPLDVALSTLSPQSIAQSAMDGVGLAGKPSVAEGEGLTVASDPVIENGQITLDVESASDGTVNVFHGENGVAGAPVTAQVAPGTPVTIEVPAEMETGGVLYISFETTEGLVQALTIPVGES